MLPKNIRVVNVCMYASCDSALQNNVYGIPPMEWLWLVVGCEILQHSL